MPSFLVLLKSYLEFLLYHNQNSSLDHIWCPYCILPFVCTLQLPEVLTILSLVFFSRTTEGTSRCTWCSYYVVPNILSVLYPMALLYLTWCPLSCQTWRLLVISWLVSLYCNVVLKTLPVWPEVPVLPCLRFVSCGTWLLVVLFLASLSWHTLVFACHVVPVVLVVSYLVCL
jgi:hypothetical protein